MDLRREAFIDDAIVFIGVTAAAKEAVFAYLICWKDTSWSFCVCVVVREFLLWVQKTCFIFNLGEESKTKQKIRKLQIGKWYKKEQMLNSKFQISKVYLPPVNYYYTLLAEASKLLFWHSSSSKIFGNFFVTPCCLTCFISR